MWMQALLWTPYLVLASSAVLVLVIVSICWTQAVARDSSFAAARQLDRRVRFETQNSAWRRASERRDGFVYAQPVLRPRRSARVLAWRARGHA